MKSVGFFCGSFSPFHVGHLNIAQKAANIFDDIFIIQAKNRSKNIQQNSLPIKNLKLNYGFKCVELEEGDLLTDFITRIERTKETLYGSYSGYDKFCIIRGIRNIHDLVYEQNLEQAYRLLKPNINIVHIFCNPEFNFISSSLLRQHGNLPEFKKLIV